MKTANNPHLSARPVKLPGYPAPVLSTEPTSQAKPRSGQIIGGAGLPVRVWTKADFRAWAKERGVSYGGFYEGHHIFVCETVIAAHPLAGQPGVTVCRQVLYAETAVLVSDIEDGSADFMLRHNLTRIIE